MLQSMEGHKESDRTKRLTQPFHFFSARPPAFATMCSVLGSRHAGSPEFTVMGRPPLRKHTG